VTAERAAVELGPLGFDGGAHVLVKLALTEVERGERLAVRGTHPELAQHLATWCRHEGHRWCSGGADGEAGMARRA